jgi:U6 snRNA-associated Sm-like protein LSm7
LKPIVTGTLKGYDQLMNLVLDDVKEITRGMQRINHPSPSVLFTSTSLLYTSLTDFSCPFTSLTQRSTDDEGNTSSRPLGLLVARGTLLVLISPLDGSEEIPNPFVQAEEGEGAAAI